MRQFFVITSLAASLIGSTLSAFAGENCTCRYKGQDIAEGMTVCMNLPNGQKMAKCERVLNNTSWKFLKSPCPLANYQPIESGKDKIMTEVTIPKQG